MDTKQIESNRNIGGSILPSNNREALRLKEHANGSLQVRVLKEADTHGLYFKHPADTEFILIAAHPNGFSCDELGKRIIDVWNKKGDVNRAMAQFDYILDCGGLGMKRSSMEAIINQLW